LNSLTNKQLAMKNPLKTTSYTLSWSCAGRSSLPLKAILSSCILALFTACSSLTPPCAARVSPPYAELRGTKWELIRWNLPPNAAGEVRQRLIPQGDAGQPIQFEFAPQSLNISGFTGCNRFTGEIVEEPRGISIERVASTRMSCSGPRNELENDFLYELNDYRNLVRDGDRLLMIGRDREVLSFIQRPASINPKKN